MDEGYLLAGRWFHSERERGRKGRRDNSMMYDITAITALMEVDAAVAPASAAAAAGDGDGLAVTGQTVL